MTRDDVRCGLLGLSDGVVSTLAPIFAAAYLAGSHAALLVGLAASLGAAVSMALAEAMSDEGNALRRGAITGTGTLIGGLAHALPFLIHRVSVALMIAYVVVSIELFAIAWVRRHFLSVPLKISLVQITAGGAFVTGLGILLGQV